MSEWATLDKDHNVIPIAPGEEMEEFLSRGDRIVGKANVGEFRVSTVFLGLNHASSDSVPAQWFETMIFPKDNYHDLECWRYATWDEAVRGHAHAIEVAEQMAKGDYNG